MEEETVSKLDFKAQIEFQGQKLGLGHSEEDLREVTDRSSRPHSPRNREPPLPNPLLYPAWPGPGVWGGPDGLGGEYSGPRPGSAQHVSPTWVAGWTWMRQTGHWVGE